MANIAEILEQASTVADVDKFYVRGFKQRRRLGLSQAGHKCQRFLWYKHRGFDEPVPEGRVLRLFQLGNMLEDQTIEDLAQAGLTVHSCQKQVDFQYDDMELTGSIDGIVEGLVEAPKTPHLFEHKTCSKKKYEELLKKGYRAWNDVYYWQTQFYMLGLGLKRAAAFVYCKDDSRLYMERIKLDRDATIERLQTVFEAIEKPSPPCRACPRMDHWEAKFCPFYEECFNL